MKIVLRFPVKQPKKLFKVDKSFKTRSKITKRTVLVSQAYGIGVDEEKVFPVFRDFEIDINPNDVVYITGDSGSGKSTLLKMLSEKILESRQFGGVIDANGIRIDENEILVEGVGKSTKEALTILSMAGLNEAFLFLRRYKELSDGQKYRYKIAKMIDSGKDTWVADEFCATLDRTTAKVVAYCMQKIARKLMKTVIVATTHEDLLYDLNPSVYIRKKFGPDVEARNIHVQAGDCSLLRKIRISEGTKDDYRRLEDFHYRGASTNLVKKIFSAKIKDELVGVIVYVCPHVNLKARNYALPEYKPKRITRAYLKKLNRDFIRIARVVVLPKFRSIGLGAKLVHDTLPLVKIRYVETLAVMAKYNPFFEKAGMKRIEPPETKRDRSYKRCLEQLESMGFNLDFLASKKYTMKVISRLSRSKIGALKSIVLREFICKKFRSPALADAVRKGDKAAIADALKGARLDAVYCVWENPKL
jgi:ABC-type ATPase with predicted acetyltransferase domain